VVQINKVRVYVVVDIQLHIYDIREPVHNSLVLKQSLKTSNNMIPEIDMSIANLQVVKTRESPDDLYMIIISMNEEQQVIYKFDPNTELVLNRETQHIFN
jgi:hypothetical protein